MTTHGDLTELLDELRLSFHALTRVADAAHAPRGITAPMRAVMEFLFREGAAPVPRIAAARGVSRQHVQTIVNELVAAGLAARRPNPAHARSSLFELTEQGRQTMAAIVATEADLLGPVAAALPSNAVATALRTLRRLRAEVDALTDALAGTTPERTNR